MVSAVILDVIAPILLMVGCGALLRRRFAINVDTLSKVNLYLCTPAFVFDRVTHSRLGGGEMIGIVTVTAILIFTMGGITFAIGRWRGTSRRRVATLAMAAMFYNSGNYGLPLSELAYPISSGRDGAASQTFVVLAQNFLTFTLGLAIAAGADAHGIRHIASRMLRMPVIYTLTFALLGHHFFGPESGRVLPKVVTSTTRYLAGGLVPIALVVLGAQLAISPRWPPWRDVGYAIAMRLFAGPAMMAGLLYLMHRQLPGTMWDLWPWPAEVLILTAGVPSAVNTLLLVLELDGDPKLTADTVFWTTVVSTGSILMWLTILRTTMGT